MNNYQVCSNLEVENNFDENVQNKKDNFEEVLMLQKHIQENVYGYNFKELQNGSLKQMREFFDWNYHAIQDELREMMNALGGVKDGIGSGVWKPWKKTFKESDSISFSEMSETDLLELKYELVDIQHFINNLILAVGMSPEEFVNLYYAKNKENINRQKRGY